MEFSVTESPAIKKIVIVGGGTAGWMAAATCARVFGERLDITLVESEEIGIVGVGEATIPQIHLLTQLLGIDEDDFLRRINGTFKLAIEFVGWGKPGESYLHAFGPIGRGLGMAEFQHYWWRAQAAGRLPAGDHLWNYSPAAVAARANRFARLDRIEGLPHGLAHAFHFDAALVSRYLRSHAEKRGVRRIEGRIQNVLQDEHGLISALQLDGERRIEGDFFIDCSGFRGLVIEGALHAGYEDWTHWLPCDRAMAVPCESASPLLPYTRASARAAGWQWRIPLQHRIGNGHVYSSAWMSDDEATVLLLANLDGKPLADPRPLRFTTGRRRKFWDKNCVALGLSSGFMEPLESTSIHLVQSGLSRLLTLFPPQRHCSALADEYNRQCIFEFERIRDFLILHYHLNGRDEPFWQDRRNMRIPDSLAAKMELFREEGRIHREADELFTEVAWLQVMTGQGLRPRRHHPLAHLASDAQVEEFLQLVRDRVGKTVAMLPDHAEFIARHCRAEAA